MINKEDRLRMMMLCSMSVNRSSGVRDGHAMAVIGGCRPPRSDTAALEDEQRWSMMAEDDERNEERSARGEKNEVWAESSSFVTCELCVDYQARRVSESRSGKEQAEGRSKKYLRFRTRDFITRPLNAVNVVGVQDRGKWEYIVQHQLELRIELPTLLTYLVYSRESAWRAAHQMESLYRNSSAPGRRLHDGTP